jgi:Domain of unknown function (DUF1735)/Domain of unknown function (DUF4361)
MRNSIINTCLILSGVFLAASCAYEEKDNLAGQGPNILRADAGPDKLVVASTVTSSVMLATVWRDANLSSSLNQPVSVSFSTDPAIVTAYNAENGTEYLPLGASLFTFNPSTLNFGAGVFNQDVGITLKAVGLDLSKDYAIGLVMNASGWTAGGDKFIKLALPSAYEGDYISTGTRYNFSTVGDAITTTWPPTGWVSFANWTFNPTTANTLSSRTVAVHAGNSNGGFGRINITVNTDNSVTIVPNSDIGLNELVQSTHRPSTYNPTTKTFELYYQYTNTTGTFRLLYDKLVKK